MDGSARRPTRRRTGVLVALVASIALAACGGDATADPSTTTTAPQPDADAYGAALATVLDDEPDPDADGEVERTVVFIVPLDDIVDIEAQAAIIVRFEDAYDVRFVDDLAAAVQEDEPSHPPRDDAMVIGLGSITLDTPHRVRLERYESTDSVQATRVTLEYDPDGWQVVMTEPVPAEVLVDAL